jgi:hypothetical protein
MIFVWLGQHRCFTLIVVVVLVCNRCCILSLEFDYVCMQMKDLKHNIITPSIEDR